MFNISAWGAIRLPSPLMYVITLQHIIHIIALPPPLLLLTAIMQESHGSVKQAYTMKGEGYKPNQKY
jgi:hypothetical protein